MGTQKKKEEKNKNGNTKQLTEPMPISSGSIWNGRDF